jgi:hypothetical protein
MNMGMAMAQILIRDFEKTLKQLNRRAASQASVWNWLKRRTAGNLSKHTIDAYIRAERNSWHNSF